MLAKADKFVFSNKKQGIHEVIVNENIRAAQFVIGHYAVKMNKNGQLVDKKSDIIILQIEGAGPSRNGKLLINPEQNILVDVDCSVEL